MSINLGPRLSVIAQYVPRNARLGDIGTDHAYLPIFLYEQGLICQAVGVDIHKGPFLSAVSAVKEHKAEAGIKIRLGDGLTPVRAGEVDTLTIAGMGGNTILEILTAQPAVVTKVTRLILQPQGSEDKVRLHLLKENWGLWDETLVEEEGRIYTVLVFTREQGRPLARLSEAGKHWYESVQACLNNEDLAATMAPNDHFPQSADETAYSLYWKFGPLIIANDLKSPDPLLGRLIEEQIDQLEKQIEGMKITSRPEVKAKIAAVGQKIRMLYAIKAVRKEAGS